MARRYGRPPLPRDVRVRFWDGIRAGLPVPAAGNAAGAGHSAALGWFTRAGGVKGNGEGPASGRYLSLAEREEIALGLARKESFRQIGARLGRPASTISREVRRNDSSAGYRAMAAQARAEARAARPKEAKLAVNAELRQWVQARLEENWSPEQVSALLRAEFAARPEMRVSHETIYQSLYVQGRGALRRDLTRHLRTGRALRKPRRQDGERRPRLPDMVNISERPAQAADRAVPGHWEGDLIMGRRNQSAIGTLVERSTRFTMLLYLPDGHDAAQVAEAMAAEISTLPQTLRRSLAWDQGREMAAHAQVTLATGMDVYFCDPHSPWQRGSNENTNGLLRQYFPKSADLTAYSREDLDKAAAELNSRPRKTLGWQTPAQALEEVLDQAAA